MVLSGKLPGDLPGVPPLMLLTGTGEGGICCFFQLCLRLQSFLLTDFINGHMTGWCHLADGLGKVQSVTFTLTVPFSTSSTLLHPYQWPLKSTMHRMAQSHLQTWIALGPCNSQDSAFLERADYRRPGKL